MSVTPVYAAVLGLLFVVLSMRVISVRRARKTPLGAHGDPSLERAMRVHANFAEYAPLALLLIGMLELKGAGPVWLHALCGCLLAGRLIHAYGVSQTNEDFRFRVAGMMLTFGAIAGASLGLLLTAL